MAFFCPCSKRWLWVALTPLVRRWWCESIFPQKCSFFVRNSSEKLKFKIQINMENSCFRWFFVFCETENKEYIEAPLLIKIDRRPPSRARFRLSRLDLFFPSHLQLSTLLKNRVCIVLLSPLECLFKKRAKVSETLVPEKCYNYKRI